MCWDILVFTDGNLVTFQMEKKNRFCLKASQHFAHSVCLQLNPSTHSPPPSKKCIFSSFLLCQQSKTEGGKLPNPKSEFRNILTYSLCLMLMRRTDRWWDDLSSRAGLGKGEMRVRSSESFWQQSQSSTEPFSGSPPSLPSSVSPPPLYLLKKVTISPAQAHTRSLSLSNNYTLIHKAFLCHVTQHFKYKAHFLTSHKQPGGEVSQKALEGLRFFLFFFFSHGFFFSSSSLKCWFT